MKNPSKNQRIQELTFWKTISKINSAIARLMKKRKEIQINIIRNKGNSTTGPTEMQTTISEYYKHLYAHKLGRNG